MRAWREVDVAGCVIRSQLDIHHFMASQVGQLVEIKQCGVEITRKTTRLYQKQYTKRQQKKQISSQLNIVLNSNSLTPGLKIFDTCETNLKNKSKTEIGLNLELIFDVMMQSENYMSIEWESRHLNRNTFD